ncbi:unnamed protein product [Discula destructiva]
MRPEAARERDLHRYYKPWKDARNSLVDVDINDHERGSAWGLTYEGYKPRASGDKTLTAFAQLATLRLNVRRAMISLVDSAQQYILAEATQTLSLVSDERYQPGDEIWLGNTIIKRNDAVCHHSFGQKYSVEDDDGRAYTAEAMVIPDMRLDDRFKDRDYVKQEPGIIFYAGVPIRTKSGHRIGVYAVSSEKSRPPLTFDEVVFMEDVAAAVMEHLELAKDRDARMNGEKMVRGLADFIEGTEEPDTPAGSISNQAEDQLISPRISAVMRRQSVNTAKMLLDADNEVGSTAQANSPVPDRREEKPAKSRVSRDEASRILSRAATIIRQSTDADGVIFFNTSSRNFQGLSRRALRRNNTDLSSGLNSGSDMSADPVLPSRQRQADSTDSGEDFRTPKSNSKPSRALCEVIGLSISQHEQYGKLSAEDFGFPEENMEKYIKNFPWGKFFSFTDTGSGISSGDEVSSEDKPSPAEHQPNLERRPSGTRKDIPPRNKNERFVPTELLKVLPGIRSLIFLPLWDFVEGKYIAGGFIWTSTAGRLMSPENELPYLKAFGNSIMSEISRVKATKSDLAKTTFIASISHELRSPLHGILGSVEFLHETAVSAYQAGLFTSIETCGKTLLDTIDHVLDYAKINKLRKGSASRKRHNQRSGQKKDQVSSIVGLTTTFDLAALVEATIDAVSAGHSFRRSHQVTGPEQDSYGVALAGMGTTAPSPTDNKPPHEPVVILDITPRSNWFVRTQPGALRRIVMNLLGNALKYTDAGFVFVSLQVESETDSQIKVRFRFLDSGRGMSLEFQRTRLFAPFSQEDPFSTGTGLGLSIVRQIIESHDGNISIKSTQYVGTEVNVVMTLPIAECKHEIASLNPTADSTKGRTICVMDPVSLASIARPPLYSTDIRGLDDLRDTLRETCEGWFGMNVVEHPNEAKPDFVLLPMVPTSAEEILKYYNDSPGSKLTAPLIVLCTNTGQASDFRSGIAGKLLQKGIVAMPIVQPLGPRKLAGVIEKFREEHTRRRQRIVLGRKESDPEADRRERRILRTVEKAQRAEQGKVGQDASDRWTLPEQIQGPHALRPGPSPVVHTKAIDETIPTQDDPSEPLASPTHNLIRGRILAQSSLRSRSAPPLGPLSATEPASTSTLSMTSVLNGAASTRTHILLVDDNHINLQLLVMFTKKQNMSYATASNGLLALETYRAAFLSSSAPGQSSETAPAAAAATASGRHSTSKSPPPFTHVLMDISMPVMDGLTSTRKIRAFEAENGIEPPSTIIALTGLASAEAQEDALNAGITKFLVKPVKFGELKGLLKESRAE